MEGRFRIRLGLFGDIDDGAIHTALSLFASNFRLSVVWELKNDGGVYQCKIGDYEIVVSVNLFIPQLVVTSDTGSYEDLKEKTEYLAELLNKLGAKV